MGEVESDRRRSPEHGRAQARNFHGHVIVALIANSRYAVLGASQDHYCGEDRKQRAPRRCNGGLDVWMVVIRCGCQSRRSVPCRRVVD